MSRYVLRIEGKRTSHFIALLMRFRISFIKISEGRNFLVIEVNDDDYEKIKKIRTSYEITIVKRKGLAHFLYLCKSKRLFLITILFSFLVFLLLTKLTFSVEIIETDHDMREMILEDLEEFGIKKYHFKVDYKTKEEIRNKILEKEKENLEWLEIEEIGTKYQVKLIKRIKKEEAGEEEARHIVARKKGMITRIEAEHGEVAVKKYQMVEQGDVLISGLIKNKETIKAKVAAKGQVFAEIWYEVKMSLPRFYHEEKKTGKRKQVLEISFLNKNIFLSELFRYQNSKSQQNILWHHPLLPLFISYTKKEEVNIKSVNYMEENMDQKVIPLAVSKLKDKLGDNIVILSEKVLKKSTSAGKMEVEIFFKVEEDITSYQSLKDFNIEEENKKQEEKE